jgi:hypothetical protein
MLWAGCSLVLLHRFCSWQEVTQVSARSICAGDMPVSWSGVFLTSGMGSSSPLGLMESLITLSADPTDLSAFWLIFPYGFYCVRDTEAVEALTKQGDEVVGPTLALKT